MGCIFCEDFQKPGLYKPHIPCALSSPNGTSCIPCTKIQPLEAQILKAKKALDDLIELHRKIRTRMNRIHNRTILQLPRELVSMIFQYTLPSMHDSLVFDLYGFQVESSRKEAASAPLVLGAVCQDWRRIAWSTPQLWTFIPVRLDPSDLPSYKIFIWRWLHRSGSLPLSIHVYIRNSSNSGGPSSSDGLDHHVDNLINIINRTSTRWRLLDLRKIPERFISKFIYNSSSSTFIPMLSSLRIQTLEDNHQSVAVFKAQNAHPSPTNIYISNLRLKSVDIEWNNATHVELASLQLDECLEVLKLAPHIQNLELYATQPVNEERYLLPSRPVIHHNLQKFTLYPSLDPLSLFLDHVSFPSLKFLNIGPNDEHLPVADLSSFFHRSSCRLEQLAIGNAELNNDDIVSLLWELPSLVELRLFPTPISEHSPSVLFKLLASSSILGFSEEGRELEESLTFLPNLRTLRYQSVKNPSWDEPGENRFSWDLLPPVFGPLSELKNPRRRPFQSLELFFDRDKTEDDPTVIIGDQYIDSLLSISEAGLDLDIAYPDEGLDVILYSINEHS